MYFPPHIGSGISVNGFLSAFKSDATDGPVPASVPGQGEQTGVVDSDYHVLVLLRLTWDIPFCIPLLGRLDHRFYVFDTDITLGSQVALDWLRSLSLEAVLKSYSQLADRANIHRSDTVLLLR